eukprot:TRINITY_DN25371_c0_g1_i1.p1 TRINITY_DN25371_c0_g1~~TRINITY_DN25371_c0_g1_i1.p1  ORF type:complete len:841 (+),score=122.54 TRINITY_DN25371_c0_g1_i1:150-2672(+)
MQMKALLSDSGHCMLRQCLDRLRVAEEAVSAARQAVQNIVGDDEVCQHQGWSYQKGSPTFELPASPQGSPMALLGDSAPLSTHVGTDAEQAEVRPSLHLFDHVMLVPEQMSRTSHKLGNEGSMADWLLSRRLSKVFSNLSNKSGGDQDQWWNNPNYQEASSKSPLFRNFVWRLCVCGLQVPVLNPESGVRFQWIMIGFCMNLYEAIAIPVYLAFDFEPEGFTLVLAHLINMYFLMDIPCQFLTGYTTPKGNIIFDIPGIARRYGSTWLTIDLVAAVPWEWISLGDNDLRASTSSARMLRMIRVFRLMRLLRLMKMQALTQVLEQFYETNRAAVFAIEIFRLLFALGLVVHWGSCLWHGVGMRSESVTWLKHYELDKLSGGERYLWALYYTLTMMSTVGFGDLTPKNGTEIHVTIGMLIVSTLVFSLLMGVLMDLIGNLRRHARILSDRRMALARYMRWRTLPRPVAMKIRQYMMFQWDSQEGFDNYEKDIRSKLPPVLQCELCYQIFGKVIREAPFFFWMSGYNSCIKSLAGLTHSSLFERDDYLFRKGEPSVKIHFVLSGVLRITQNQMVSEDRQEDHLAQTSSFSGRLKGLKALTAGETNHADDDDLIPHGLTNSVFADAEQKLREQDEVETKAAIIVQRRYRWMKMHKSLKHMIQSRATGGATISKILSRTVAAPVYFGESCLWVPFEEWSNAESLHHVYSTRCQTRGESVVVTREAVRQVITAHSPWLYDRFEQFRCTVIEGTENLYRGGSSTQTAAQSADSTFSPASTPVKNGFDSEGSSSEALAKALPNSRESTALVETEPLPTAVKEISSVRLKFADAQTKTGEEIVLPGMLA